MIISGMHLLLCIVLTVGNRLGSNQKLKYHCTNRKCNLTRRMFRLITDSYSAGFLITPKAKDVFFSNYHCSCSDLEAFPKLFLLIRKSRFTLFCVRATEKTFPVEHIVFAASK